MKYRILYLAVLFLPVAASAQSVRVQDTIRFEVVQDKIIIPATLGGRPTRFIIDTGGRNLITRDSAEYHNVEPGGRQLVSDVNSGGVSMLTAQAKDLQLSDNIRLTTTPMLVTAPNKFFRTLGVAGLLGSEAFSKVCLTIDKRAGYIVMSYPYGPRGLSKDDAISIPPHDYSHPYIPVRIGEKEIYVLFDTGMSGFLSLTGDDHRKLAGDPAVSVDNEGYGFLNVGIGGIRTAKAERLERVRLARLSFGGKRFENAVSTSQNLGGNSIMGLELLDHGRIVLDYPRSRVYFLPYDDSVADMKESTKIWNVKILPIVDHFEVTAVFGDAGVGFGERVWAIGDTQLEGAELSELYITELMDSVAGDTCDITVGEEKSSLRKVTIRKL